ncbi:MAG TPA: ribonuclease HII [Clostridia bacterium]|nr:ribonuclease HII [Clostridia bacterium]
MDWHLYENEARKNGFRMICGIDEAGRGPLAGPVFAAAVILPENFNIEGLNDSKKLSEKKRNELFDVIRENAVAYNVAAATQEEIDNINVLQATFLAMKRAQEGLKTKADFALVDGNRLPPLTIQSKIITKGDSISASIAAASILAKVGRDKFMLELDEIYPQYKFAQHKGYGTKLHYEMIKEHGISPVHRRSFLKKLL